MAKNGKGGGDDIYKYLLGLALIVASYSLGWYRGSQKENYL